MHQAAPALLLLALRVACLGFLLLYPLARFVARALWRPWVRASLARGARYVLEPLALLETKRLHREALAALGPAPAPKRDINAVSFADLCEVEGVGAGRAREIVSYREDYGPFRRMEELGLVKGVGPKLFRALCERFEVPEERRRSETAAHRRAALTRSLSALLPAPPALLPPPHGAPRLLAAPRALSGEAAGPAGGYIDVSFVEVGAADEGAADEGAPPPPAAPPAPLREDAPAP